MPSFEERWQPEINWETPAGRTIDRLVAALPKDQPWTIIIFGFGSSPLQLALDPTFLSGDVDVIPSMNIEEHCRRAGLLKGQTSLYIEPCTPAAFTASPDWSVRACEIRRGHVTFILPHPIDILASKIKRLEEKDLEAFRLVRAKTGHPTEDELLIALRRIVDVYRPSFDEEAGGDPRHNTVVLWQELFKQPINVSEQIITPALEQRRQNYGPQGYELRDALRKVT